MSLPAPLRWLICLVGALRKRFGRKGGSPHNARSRSQAAALAAELERRFDAPMPVSLAFAACPPLVEALIAEPAVDRQRIFVSMSPSDSRLSCGLICHALRETGQGAERAQVLARLWDDAEFVALNVNHARAACDVASESEAAKTALVLVFHGTLVRNRRGQAPDFDTGLAAKQQFSGSLRTALLALDDAPWSEVFTAYLNHDVAGAWTQPTVASVLDDLGRRGVERVWAFPCDYLVESSELVGGLADALSTSPIQETRRVPCLNDSPAFMRYLAERIGRALDSGGEGLTCQGCPRPSAAQSPAMGTSGAKSKLS